MKDKKMFGSFIKEKRIEKNYSQKDLAELLFVTESAVSKWERGVSYPDITLIHDICRVLEITEHELIESSNDVAYRKMKKDATKFNRIKKKLFWTFNILYLIAIITCFIVNLAVEHTLSWFFIVFASILVAYSFCPTFTWVYSKYKILIFIGSSFLSLFILFLVCSIYTSNYWFMISTCGVLLAYFIIFYPILFKKQKSYLDKEKYHKLSKSFMLTYIFGIFIIILLLLIAINCYSKYNISLGFRILIGIFIIPFLFEFLNFFNVSKTIYKIILTMIILMLILFSLFIIGTSIYQKSTKVTNTYIINNIKNEIKIECDIYDINIYLSDTSENKIICDEYKNMKIEYAIESESLTIKQKDKRKLFEKIFNPGKNPTINIYLTNNLINELNINLKTGNIKINDGLTFKNVKINNSTGKILFKANVNNDLNIINKTGDISIKDSKISNILKINSKTGKVEIDNVLSNSLEIETKTGNTLLKNTAITNDLNLKGSTGDVILDSFDAKNITIKISTGNIKGTLLSEKIFIANSSTGNVKVPESLTGSICKLTTTTGNINIKYKN